MRPDEALWTCTEVLGHACEVCRPDEFPELAPRCAECRRPFTAAARPPRTPSGRIFPTITVDGVVMSYYWRGYKIGIDGWVDACGQTPGLAGPTGLHVCPCVGVHQCHHRLRGHVREVL